MGHSLLLDTCVVILHRKILMTRQGFSSLSIHQEEELRYDKKTTTTTIARDYGGTPLMTATNGPWKSIRIDRSKSISLTCTSYSRYFTPPINDLNFFQKLPPSMYVCKYACMYLFFSTSDNNSLFSFFFCVHVRFFWRRFLGTGIGELHKQSVKKKQIILSKYGIKLLRLCSNNYHPHLISCGFFIEFDFPAFSKNTLLDYHNHKRPKP